MSKANSQVIEVLYWPQLAIEVEGAFLLELAHSFRIGWIAVDVYDTWRYRVPGPESFAEEALSSLYVTSRAEHKLYCVAS